MCAGTRTAAARRARGAKLPQPLPRPIGRGNGAEPEEQIKRGHHRRQLAVEQREAVLVGTAALLPFTQSTSIGTATDEFVCAGISTYEKRGGRWMEVANVSTFEPRM
jgi:hypothetical protein